MDKILRLLEQWDAPRNEYWIGIEPLAVESYQMGTTLRVGPECKTIDDLEKVAAIIRADLDEILAEAREKIAKHNQSIS